MRTSFLTCLLASSLVLVLNLNAHSQPAKEDTVQAKETKNSLGMKFVYIPAGEFRMGSALSEEELAEKKGWGKLEWYGNEFPQHRVRITRPYYLSVFEVTQEQYERVTGNKPSRFQGANLPVDHVSWTDAVQFCRKLSQMEGRKYRLPTEAEWEYACRAGSTTPFYFGGDASRLGEYAWGKSNAGRKTHPVGTKRPNAWGLHDMHGNVWEWCHDWLETNYYRVSPAEDPPGPERGSMRVSRGGGWDSVPLNCRSADRNGYKSNQRYDDHGFRVVLEVRPKSNSQ